MRLCQHFKLSLSLFAHLKLVNEMYMYDHLPERLENVQPGDCIVCFNKNDIYSVSRGLENKNKECAVIYGGLPPGMPSNWCFFLLFIYLFYEACL